jgi:protein phosphatase
MHIQSICETGNRPQNEDFIISATLSETSSIHIVADGMGGYEHGDLASQTVALSIVDYLKRHITETSVAGASLLDDVCNAGAHLQCVSSVEFLIRNAIAFSNQAIQKLRSLHHSKMGATLAGLLIINQHAFAFWVGDARIYHIQNKQICFQSTDHSLINQIAASGQIINPALKQQYGHIVTRSIQGNQDEVIPDIVNFKSLTTSDHFILCSDGVHNVISPSHLQNLITMNPDPNNFIAEVNKICSQDGNDNYSLISISL